MAGTNVDPLNVLGLNISLEFFSSTQHNHLYVPQVEAQPLLGVA